MFKYKVREREGGNSIGRSEAILEGGVWHPSRGGRAQGAACPARSSPALLQGSWVSPHPSPRLPGREGFSRENLPEDLRAEDPCLAVRRAGAGSEVHTQTCRTPALCCS